jgi:hypothetical protein
MNLIYQKPIGTRAVRSACGAHGPIEIPEYPPSPQGRAFRNARVAADVTIRDMAKRLGLSAVHVSDVERGAAVPEDWSAFWRASELPGEGSNG